MSYNNYLHEPFYNRPNERLPYYNNSYLEMKNPTYLRYIDSPKYNENIPSIIPQNKYIITKGYMKKQLDQKIEYEYREMLIRQENERNNLENITNPPTPLSPEKKEKYENKKINGVMEDMYIYGNVVKNEILNKKQKNPEKFIQIEVALNNEQQDPGLFALALIASDFKNKGIEAAIVNDNAIIDRKEIEEEENSAITCLQFMSNGLLLKKKYEFHFDLDDKRVNEILNNINEYEGFKENLKNKLHKEFNIPKDKIIITFP